MSLTERLQDAALTNLLSEINDGIWSIARGIEERNRILKLKYNIYDGEKDLMIVPKDPMQSPGDLTAENTPHIPFVDHAEMEKINNSLLTTGGVIPSVGHPFSKPQ